MLRDGDESGKEPGGNLRENAAGIGGRGVAGGRRIGGAGWCADAAGDRSLAVDHDAMKIMTRCWGTTEEHLACDEAVLDACESGESGTEAGVLRFYEVETPCVVVGYGNRVETEVDLTACDEVGVAVLRRASGGGTVVLGPGCLAYALVLPVALAPELSTVTGTNRWVMERNRRAMEAATGRRVTVRGHTDLAIDEWKFSGNAQRRRQRAVLFHGTILCEMDLERVSGLLPMPSWQPEYRKGRRHGDFLMNLGIPGERVREALAEAWGVTGTWDGGGALDLAVGRWMAERYGQRAWHRRF